METPFVGSVKWFNNRNGFGFITASDGPYAGKDIFAHHSAIQVSNEQYRYLCQGEYVEFTVSTAANGKHDIQATHITGVKGGKLMCETQRENPRPKSRYPRPYQHRNSQSRDDGFTQVQRRREPSYRRNRDNRDTRDTRDNRDTRDTRDTRDNQN